MRILTVHGIRRKKKWYREFRELPIIKEKGIDVINFEYGYFDIYSFAAPWRRKRVIEEFIEFFDEEVFEDERPSIICHSFGSYIIYNTLFQQKTIKIDKLILTGCILKPKLDWKHLFDRDQIGEIYHDYGVQDEVVKYSSFIRCCGDSGKKGFQIQKEISNKITQEKNNFGHSGYFTKRHMIKIWTSFLLKGLPKFKFNRDVFTFPIVEKVYSCDIYKSFELSSATFIVRVDKQRNYFAHYISEGFVKEDDIHFYRFKTSADSNEAAKEMQFISFDRTEKLQTQLLQDNKQFKSFDIYFDKPKNNNESFYIEKRFQWHQVMNFGEDGDTDHWFIKNISNIYISMNYPFKLKQPVFVFYKNKTPQKEVRAQMQKEIDGTYTYHLTYNNYATKYDVLVFGYDGTFIEEIEDNYSIVSTRDFDGKKYKIIKCQEKQIDYVYDLERKIEGDYAAHKTILKQRKETFNDGFLIVLNEGNQVVSYLESIIWRKPTFKKFAEIKSFSMFHNIAGNELYVIFLATDPSYRKLGIASWLIDEIIKTGLKYGVDKISLVAKENLENYYQKSGFTRVKVLSEFLPDRNDKSILMERAL